MRRKGTIDVEKITYHRNGISGIGFHVVAFTFTEGGVLSKMVGVVFPQPCAIAVFDREKLGAGIIEFFNNSWRGDHFEDDLRTAIAAAENATIDPELGMRGLMWEKEPT